VQGQDVRVTDSDESTPVDWATDRGWYLDLCLQPCAAPTGERQVTDAILRNDRIIFTTLIPNTEQCSFGGTSWLMELDAPTGGRLEFGTFDLNQDEVFNDADKAPGAPPSDPALVSASGLKSTVGILPSPTILAAGNVEKKYASGSETSTIMEVTEHPGVGAVGRQSWQQIVQ
jgi:type IV pilus assembly protein PilY1